MAKVNKDRDGGRGRVEPGQERDCLGRGQEPLFDDNLLTQGSGSRAREWLGGWGPGAQR